MTKACYRFQNRNHKQGLLYHQPKQCSITEILQNYQQHFSMKFDPLKNRWHLMTPDKSWTKTGKSLISVAAYDMFGCLIVPLQKKSLRKNMLKKRRTSIWDSSTTVAPSNHGTSLKPTKFTCSDQDNHFQPPLLKSQVQVQPPKNPTFTGNGWISPSFLDVPETNFSPWMGFRRLSPIIKTPPKRRTRKSLCPRC